MLVDFETDRGTTGEEAGQQKRAKRFSAQPRLVPKLLPQ